MQIMKETKRKKLEAAGWKVGSAREFLNLSDEEAAFVENQADSERESESVRHQSGPVAE
jgi:hypothetical protein